MCIRDSQQLQLHMLAGKRCAVQCASGVCVSILIFRRGWFRKVSLAVSYTHLRAHETLSDL
eukprot:8949678-Karenia_brevis.AAC.1